MANHQKKRARTSSASLHHRRQDDERSGVNRHQDQDESNYRQSGRDDDPTQPSGAAGVRIIESAARLNLLHDRGLPGLGAYHTSSLTGRETVRG
jgi:hypothetical protein